MDKAHEEMVLHAMVTGLSLHSLILHATHGFDDTFETSPELRIATVVMS
jgi:hypothetical protein